MNVAHSFKAFFHLRPVLSHGNPQSRPPVAVFRRLNLIVVVVIGVVTILLDITILGQTANPPLQQQAGSAAQLAAHAYTVVVLINGLMLTLLIVLLGAIRRANRIIQAQHAELIDRHAACVQLQHARDDLTQLIVHDLRNPVTAIGGYLDILTRYEHDPERRALIAGVRQSTFTLQALIGTILDFQRLQDGTIPLTFQPVDVAELLRISAEEFCGWAQRDGKRIRLDVPHRLPPVCADPDILRRVIANLLSNALKHTPPVPPLRSRRATVCTPRYLRCPFTTMDQAFHPPC